MSHVIGIDLIIQDINALKAACHDHACPFMEGQTTHKWYGSWQNDYNRADAAYRNTGIDPKHYGKCVHAIQVPGSGYEIGVYANPKGKGYVLAYDNYGRSNGQVIVNKLGSGLEKLKQSYAVAKASAEAKRKGWMVQRQNLKDGSIKLVMTGAGL